METYRKQALELWKHWQAMSTPRKAAWSAGALGCFAVAGLLWWASQPDYRVLYTGLSAEEAGAITNKLQAKGVGFRLGAGGSTILVPADQAMQVHLDLTADGVAGSSKIGKGFDLFDQPMLSATPFNQHVNFMRAQQAELAKTIMQIDPIVFARVHIVRPEPSPFVRDQKPTTASVMLRLRPGATLNRNTVNGIAALVAGSVEGLPKESVRIVDASGRLLSEERDPDSGLMGSIADQRRDLEHRLAKEAEGMLERVLGAGKAIVLVRTDLNTKTTKERKEFINPEGRVAKTEKTITTKSGPAGGGKGGTVGSSPNFGKGGTSTGLAGGGTTSATESQQSEFDYPKTITEWQNKHGAIDRLTVAALIDTAALTNGDQTISLDDVKETIKKAVGFKADRDEIQVTAVKMPTPAAESIEEEWASQARLQTILTSVRNISIAVVALCALPMGWVVLRRWRVSGARANEQHQQVADELDRNPEAIAKILSLWIEAPESAERKVA